MWIFTKHSILSIVEDKNNSDRFCVRGRLPGDIEYLFSHLPNLNVIEGAGTDYRFRAFIDKEDVVKELTKEISDITYTNFKDEANKQTEHDDDNPQRMRMMHKVWNNMYQAQEDVHNMEGKNYYE